MESVFGTSITNLNDIANQIAQCYRDQLSRDGYRPEGALMNFQWKAEWNYELFSIEFILPPEWWYAENGRRPGRFPPISAMENFIRVRHIVPRAIKGKVPSTHQLAYLFARKIARKGFSGKQSLNKALNAAEPIMDMLYQKIQDSLIVEPMVEITKVFDGLKTMK